jgi:hypothetical protein
MSKDFAPQVETSEIADSELDNISGGLLGVRAAGEFEADASVVTPLGGVELHAAGRGFVAAHV